MLNLVPVLKAETKPVDQWTYLPEYKDKPVEFAGEVLGLDLTEEQKQALTLVLVDPFCVLWPSANEQGKTLGMAVAVLWWFCTRRPAIVLTTAPTERQVKDLLWKEIRRLARTSKRPLRLPFLPKAPRIERAPDDFAHGFATEDATSAHGQHGPNILIVFDEAVGIQGEIWEAMESQFSPPGHAWICGYNPTDTGSRAYLEQMQAGRLKSWHIVRSSALTHPNIEAELSGRPPPFPHAMRLAKFDRLFRKWSQLVGCPVGSPLQKATDVVWPPVWAAAYWGKTKQMPKVWRPGPLAESRLLGLFPRAGINSVWSDGDWSAAVREGILLIPVALDIPEIGCDVARYGDDYTAKAVRAGCKLLHFSEVNGQSTVATFEQLKELCAAYSLWYNQMLAETPWSVREHKPAIDPREIPIKVDDDGVGGAVTDMLAAAGYNVIPVSAASNAYEADNYPNRRSELWFATAERAREDRLDLSGIAWDPKDPSRPLLDPETGEFVWLIDEDLLNELRQQFQTATYTLDSQARRVVIAKDDHKVILKRSPDGADAVNLSFFEPPEQTAGLPEVAFTRSNPMIVNRRRLPARA